jgi:hypothetical protein
MEVTAALAKGYDMAVVVLLDNVGSLATFSTHHALDMFVLLGTIVSLRQADVSQGEHALPRGLR